MFEGQMAKAFRAMDEKDLDRVMRPWADDAVFEFPGHTPISGRQEGKAAIERFFQELFDHLESWHFTVKNVALANPIGLTYTNTIFVEYEVDETSTAGVKARNRGVTVFTWRHGKLVEGRDYFFDSTVVDRLFGEAEPVPA